MTVTLVSSSLWLNFHGFFLDVLNKLKHTHSHLWPELCTTACRRSGRHRLLRSLDSRCRALLVRLHCNTPGVWLRATWTPCCPPARGQRTGECGRRGDEKAKLCLSLLDLYISSPLTLDHLNDLTCALSLWDLRCSCVCSCVCSVPAGCRSHQDCWCGTPLHWALCWSWDRRGGSRAEASGSTSPENKTFEQRREIDLSIVQKCDCGLYLVVVFHSDLDTYLATSMKTRYSLTEKGTSLDWSMGAFLRSTSRESRSWPRGLISTAEELTTLRNSTWASLLQPFLCKHTTHTPHFHNHSIWGAFCNHFLSNKLICEYIFWHVVVPTLLSCPPIRRPTCKWHTDYASVLIAAVSPGHMGPGLWANTLWPEEKTDPAPPLQPPSPSAAACSQTPVKTQRPPPRWKKWKRRVEGDLLHNSE